MLKYIAKKNYFHLQGMKKKKKKTLQVLSSVPKAPSKGMCTWILHPSSQQSYFMKSLTSEHAWNLTYNASLFVHEANLQKILGILHFLSCTTLKLWTYCYRRQQVFFENHYFYISKMAYNMLPLPQSDSQSSRGN